MITAKKEADAATMLAQKLAEERKARAEAIFAPFFKVLGDAVRVENL